MSLGYILFNDITNRKSYIDFFSEFKQKEKLLTPQFWQEYREHKANNTDKFKTYYKPIVRDYFKKKGIIERKSYNYPIQGSSADISKLAGIYMFRELIDKQLLFTVKISNAVHDKKFVVDKPC